MATQDTEGGLRRRQFFGSAGALVLGGLSGRLVPERAQPVPTTTATPDLALVNGKIHTMDPEQPGGFASADPERPRCRCRQ